MSSPRTQVVVIGGGGHAKVVIDVLIAAGFRVAGYTDPGAAAGATIAGIPCLGDNALRERMAARAEALGFELASAVHPTACISPSATIGRGVAIMPGAVVNAGSAIGDGSIVNTCASVDHDCLIGRGVHIAPGCRLAGYVTVEDLALVGVGSVVGRGRPVRVGRAAVVGVGSVVIHDVPAGVTVTGHPARPRRPRRSPPQETA